MKNVGIPQKQINLVQICMEGSINMVLSNGIRSEPFDITTGLKQGDALSPVLFKLALEKCIRETTTVIFQNETIILGYADDLGLVREDTEQIKNMFREIKSTAEKLGLQITAD